MTFCEKHNELASRLEALQVELEPLQANEQRAAVLSRAERGFTLLGDKTACAPFSGASEVHEKARQRIVALKAEIAEVQADIAAIRLANAYTEHGVTTSELAEHNATAEKLAERIELLDPRHKVSERNATRFDARFEGVDRRAEVLAQVEQEEQAENAERVKLLRQCDELGHESRTLSSKHTQLQHEFPELHVLLAAKSMAGAA